MLAPSAFLASATGTSDPQNKMLRSGSVASPDPSFQASFDVWTASSVTLAPTGQEATKQRHWDSGIIMAVLTSLTSKVTDAVSRARLLAAPLTHAGDCHGSMLPPPITAVGLRLSINEAIRVTVAWHASGYINLCELHQCQCGAVIDARGLHSLSCRRSAGRQQRHRVQAR